MALSPQSLAQTAAERIAPLASLKVLGDDDALLIHEIYTSLQGEGTRAGRRCVFVRTAACHLRCRYCDTEHAFAGGRVQSVPEVVAAVRQTGVDLVLLTGGEPLLQRAAPALLSALCDAGLEVCLETSGAVSTAAVDPRVVTILDVKTPGSGESERHLLSTFANLCAHDEVKFVICDAADYDFACAAIAEHDLAAKCTVLFSPEASGMSATELADRLVRDRVPARLSLQLHKILWGAATGV